MGRAEFYREEGGFSAVPRFDDCENAGVGLGDISKKNQEFAYS